MRKLQNTKCTTYKDRTLLPKGMGITCFPDQS